MKPPHKRDSSGKRSRRDGPSMSEVANLYVIHVAALQVCILVGGHGKKYKLGV